MKLHLDWLNIGGRRLAIEGIAAIQARSEAATATPAPFHLRRGLDDPFLQPDKCGLDPAMLATKKWSFEVRSEVR